MIETTQCVVAECDVAAVKNTPMCGPHFDKLPQALRHKYFTYRGLLNQNTSGSPVWTERLAKSISDAKAWVEKS